VSDDNAPAHPEAPLKAISSTSTAQGDLGEAEKLLGLPEGPGLFFATIAEGEIVYCSSSEYHSGSWLVNVIINGLPYQNGRPIYAPTVLRSSSGPSWVVHLLPPRLFSDPWRVAHSPLL
jgi:hypothetical protein